jgi:hypothetical protein
MKEVGKNLKIVHLGKMREKCFNSLVSSREERILEGKIREYQKIPNKFLKILMMNWKFRKKTDNF